MTAFSRKQRENVNETSIVLKISSYSTNQPELYQNRQLGFKDFSTLMNILILYFLEIRE